MVRAGIHRRGGRSRRDAIQRRSAPTPSLRVVGPMAGPDGRARKKAGGSSRLLWWPTRPEELCGLFAAARLLGPPNGTEALLEFVDPTLGIDELLLTREEGVGIGGNTD